MSLDNPKAVKRREISLRVDERRKLEDMAFVMGDPRGRRVMNELLGRCGVGRLSLASLTPGVDGIAAAMQTSFYEGQRNIGNFYWGLLTKNFKKEWLIMTDEAELLEKAKENTNGNGNSDTSGENG